MKPAVAVLVLLFFLVVRTQGIRLQQGSISEIAQKIYEKEKGDKESSVVEDEEGAVLHCRDDCAGRSRRLLSKKRPDSQILKRDGVGVEAVLRRSLSRAYERNDEKFSIQEPTNAEFEYQDIVDIAEMDYSFARKKAPIHN